MNSRQISESDKIVILGASRGLGWAIYQSLSKLSPKAQFFLSSRKIQQRVNEVTSATQLCAQDFSKDEIDSEFLSKLKEFKPTRIIYCAGGGPYGEFSKKKWSDHLWALNTTFLFPAKLLHDVLYTSEAWQDLKQIVFIGSSIAEDKADPNAASYCAAKHALKGLIQTVQAEQSNKPEAVPTVILFSPGYMQTDMLPQNSAPRLEGLAENPTDVATKLIAVIEKNNQR